MTDERERLRERAITALLYPGAEDRPQNQHEAEEWAAALAHETSASVGRRSDRPSGSGLRSVWIIARNVEPAGVMGVYDNEDDAREDWDLRTGRGSRPDLEHKYVIEPWSVGGRAALSGSSDPEAVGLDIGAMRSVVEQAARMGSCSQTHHEWIAKAAVAALTEAKPETPA